MKKMFFAMMIVAGTVAFTACESKTTNESDGNVVDTDTTVQVETDTTVTETVVETDTMTRTIDGGESTDTVKKQ